MIRPPRAPTSVAVFLVGAWLLAGCSTSHPNTASTTTTAKAIPVPPTVSYDPAKNARSDVTLLTPCLQTPPAGAWVADGTVKNSAPSPRGYSIVIDFVNSVSTVRDTQIVTVPTVQPRASANWTISGAGGAPGITCVVRQVQTVAAQG